MKWLTRGLNQSALGYATKTMASIINRKNKSVWIAQIKHNGKTLQRSTGIPIAADSNHSERQRREEALLWAEEWERVTKSGSGASVAVARFAGALGVPVMFDVAKADKPEVPLVRVWMDFYKTFKTPSIAPATAYADDIARRRHDGCKR